MMRNSLRTVLLATLVAVLGLTGVTLAMARGTTRIGGQLAVLCSGEGFVQIELDANGKPVGAAHICPDMALMAFAAIAEAPVPVVRPLGRIETSLPRPADTPPTPVVPELRARGPPVSA